jgi:ketosteroid isomerase-like protein
VTDAEDLVRRMLEAHNRGGGDALLDAFDDFFAPDLEWTPIIVGTAGSERVTYRGREGLEHYYRDRAEVFGGGEVHIRSLESLGDAVVAHARSTAQGRVSGASVEEDVFLVYWCREGRLVRGEAFRSHEDALEVASA